MFCSLLSYRLLLLLLLKCLIIKFFFLPTFSPLELIVVYLLTFPFHFSDPMTNSVRAKNKIKLLSVFNIFTLDRCSVPFFFQKASLQESLILLLWSVPASFQAFSIADTLELPSAIILGISFASLISWIPYFLPSWFTFLFMMVHIL